MSALALADPLRRIALLASGALAAACLLGGCGVGALPAARVPPADSGAANTASAANDGAAAPADPLANLVTAVNPTGGPGGPVDIKFRVEARPQVGTPVKIMVALIMQGDAGIHHLHGSFLAGDGLELTSERSFDVADLPANNAPVYREITVVPQQTGVLSVNATILMDMDTSSESRTYSIPLIATDSSS